MDRAPFVIVLLKICFCIVTFFWTPVFKLGKMCYISNIQITSFLLIRQKNGGVRGPLDPSP